MISLENSLQQSGETCLQIFSAQRDQHQDVGAASGAFMTAFSTAGALGVSIIGLIDASLTRSSGSPQHAFTLSIIVIVLLSLGLSLTVQPLSKPLTPPNRE